MNGKAFAGGALVTTVSAILGGLVGGAIGAGVAKGDRFEQEQTTTWGVILGAALTAGVVGGIAASQSCLSPQEPTS